jgi:hypothetical protein
MDLQPIVNVKVILLFFRLSSRCFLSTLNLNKLVDATHLEVIQHNTFVYPDLRVFLVTRDLSLGFVTGHLKVSRCDTSTEVVRCYHL